MICITTSALLPWGKSIHLGIYLLHHSQHTTRLQEVPTKGRQTLTEKSEGAAWAWKLNHDISICMLQLLLYKAVGLELDDL